MTVLYLYSKYTIKYSKITLTQKATTTNLKIVIKSILILQNVHKKWHVRYTRVFFHLCLTLDSKSTANVPVVCYAKLTTG